MRHFYFNCNKFIGHVYFRGHVGVKLVVVLEMVAHLTVYAFRFGITQEKLLKIYIYIYYCLWEPYINAFICVIVPHWGKLGCFFFLSFLFLTRWPCPIPLWFYVRKRIIKVKKNHNHCIARIPKNCTVHVLLIQIGRQTTAILVIRLHTKWYFTVLHPSRLNNWTAVTSSALSSDLVWELGRSFGFTCRPIKTYFLNTFHRLLHLKYVRNKRLI